MFICHKLRAKILSFSQTIKLLCNFSPKLFGGYEIITYICNVIRLNKKDMPEILRMFGMRFFFYSREHEPIHVFWSRMRVLNQKTLKLLRWFLKKTKNLLLRNGMSILEGV